MNGTLKKLSVPRIIVLGFLSVALIATILLALPAASADGRATPLIDALFTAVSAVCVTGLVVVDTATHWSTFGVTVILITSHIGALGFMTVLTMVFMFVGKRITLKERMIIQQSLQQNELRGMVKLVKWVVAATFLLECVGGLLMTPSIMRTEQVGFLRGLWLGFFQAVCAFCSAGFVLVQGDSMTRYVTDPVVNLVMIILVLLGGLGYSVWIDIIAMLRRDKRFSLKKLSLQSRIVLDVTLGLTVFGVVFFFINEWNNPYTFGPLSLPGKLLASLFQSVTPRTLGYHTVNQADLHFGSQLMTMLYMLIGGSPGSTCGGVKTVTVAVIAASALSVIRGRNNIVLHNKEIAVGTLLNALTVVVVYVLIVFVSVLGLSFTEINNPYSYRLMDFLFETMSAAGTVGLSLGVTPYLSTGGKLIITACMLLGRIGGVTVAISLSSRRMAENTVRYPEGKLIVG